jgi:Histidine kinase-, DNA gyrase B-, and HSP90-like ATPase/PAS domain
MTEKKSSDKDQNILDNKVLYNSKRIYTSPYLTEILNASPNWTIIVDQEGRIIFANENLMKFLNISDVSEILGKTPCKLFCCINDSDLYAMEKKIPFCKHIDINKIFPKDKSKPQKTQHHTNFTICNNKRFFVNIYASPLVFESKNFVILNFEKVDEKMMNSIYEKLLGGKLFDGISSILGYLNFIKDIPERVHMEEYLLSAERITSEVQQEVQFHNILKEIESQQYKLKLFNLEGVRFIYQILENLQHYGYAENKRFIIDVNSDEFTMNTDTVLLKIALSCMLKNAMEATEINAAVRLGCNTEGDRAIFWVRNDNYIASEDQPYIFQKYFTTRENNVGLGTYTLKLICENYLKGDVYFESSKEQGTFFSIKIPLV